MIIEKNVHTKQIYLIRKCKYIVFILAIFLTGCSFSKTKENSKVAINDQFTEEFITTTELFSEITTENYDYLSKLEIDNKNLLKWEWVIEPNKYDDLYFIDKDKIAIKNKAEKWGIINVNENIILPFEYSFIGSFYENVAMVKNEEGIFYINTNGVKINQVYYDDGENFSEGYCAVSRGNKWGFINENGKMVIDYKFAEAKCFSEGYVSVKINDKWGFIDKDGNIKIKPIYDEVKGFKNNLSEVKKNSKWGVINKNGDNIVNFIYDEIGEFSEGYAPVRINDKWGFINSNGEACIAIKYAEAGCFSDGKVAVKEDKNSDLWAYVNADDKIVIDYKPYTAVGGLHSFAGEFKNSIAFASKDYYTIINDKGENIYQSYFLYPIVIITRNLMLFQLMFMKMI